VAGLSMGGGISLTLAICDPERIHRLILVDTYGLQAVYPPQLLSYLMVRIPLVTEMTYLTTRSRLMTRATLGQLIRSPGALTDELLDAVMAEARKPRAGKAFNEFQKRELMRDGLRTCYMDRLDQVRAPTLIVHGSADSLVPLDLAKEACWRIPDCRLEILEGAGHWAQRDQPDRFLAAVEEFLA
jgi:pimeloyl-ACP methyl ester carboxylesterase